MALLAHLYSHIRGSQEDIATMSLQYIVSNNKDLNMEFTHLLLDLLKVGHQEELNYICQSAGTEKERPDIAGLDSSGRERLLCEAKFYAGLTENQPITYLERLIKEDGLGLIFICPESRKKSLWAQLINLCREYEITDENHYFVRIDRMPMALISWNEIIEKLRIAAAAVSEKSLSDIGQLSDYCKLMDQVAFIPFSSEDFGPELAKKGERYYQVIDQLFHSLIANKNIEASAKGLRATPNRYGYIRYIRVNDYTMALTYDRSFWADSNCAETPFWIAITAGDWKQPAEFINVFNRYPEMEKTSYNNVVYLALYAPTNATLDEVATNMMEQILRYLEDLGNYNKPLNS